MTNMNFREKWHDKHEISYKIGMTNMKFTKNRHENMIFFQNGMNPHEKNACGMKKHEA